MNADDIDTWLLIYFMNFLAFYLLKLQNQNAIKLENVSTLPISI